MCIQLTIHTDDSCSRRSTQRIRIAVEDIPGPEDLDVPLPPLGDFTCLAATQQGNRVVLGTRCGTIVCYERAVEQRVLGLSSIVADAHTAHSITALHFEPGGSSFLWSGDDGGVLKRWEFPIVNISEGSTVVFEARVDGGVADGAPVSICSIASSIIPLPEPSSDGSPRGASPQAFAGRGDVNDGDDGDESLDPDAVALSGGVIITTSDGRILECAEGRAESTELVVNHGTGSAPSVAVYFSGDIQHVPAGHFGRSPKSPSRSQQPTIFATGGGDGVARIFNIDTHDLAVQSDWLGVDVTAVAFNFDGALLAAARAVEPLLRATVCNNGAEGEGARAPLSTPQAGNKDGAARSTAVNRASWLVLDGETLGVVFSPTDLAMCGGGGGRVVRFSPSGAILAVGCNDATILLINVSKGYKNAGDTQWAVKPKFTVGRTMKGHKSPVTHIDWASDGTILRSNASVAELRFWKADKGKKLKGGGVKARDVPWASLTCAVCWEAQGVWSNERNGTHDEAVEINAVDGAPHANFVAAVGERGTVRLFSLPCAVMDSGASLSMSLALRPHRAIHTCALLFMSALPDYHLSYCPPPHSLPSVCPPLSPGFDSLTAVGGGHGACASVTAVCWSSNGAQLLTAAQSTDEHGVCVSSVLQWTVIPMAQTLDGAYRTVQDDVMSTGGENDLLAFCVRDNRVAEAYVAQLGVERNRDSVTKTAKISPEIWDEARRAARCGAAFDFSILSEAAADECLAPQPWIGAIKDPSRPPAHIAEPPDIDVELEWVHGYEGLSFSNNVVSRDGGNIVVYPIASLVVVYSKSRHVQRFFRGHRDRVSALAAHPLDNELVVSGEVGDAPQILVWNTRTLGVVAVLDGVHRSNVRWLRFSPCGRFLASVGDTRRHVDTTRTGCGSSWDRLVLYRWRDGVSHPPCDRGLRTKLQRAALVLPLSASSARLNRVMGMDFTPDSKQIVLACDGLVAFFSVDDATWTWVPRAGITQGEDISAHTHNNARNQVFLAVCCGATFTAVGTLTGHVYLWSNASRVLTKVVRAGGRPVYSIVCDAPARRLWVGDHKGAIYAIDRWEDVDALDAVHHPIFTLNTIASECRMGAACIRALVLATPSDADQSAAAEAKQQDDDGELGLPLTTVLLVATKGAEIWRITMEGTVETRAEDDEEDLETMDSDVLPPPVRDGPPLRKWSNKACTERCLVRGHCRGQVWGVAFHPTLPQCATAGDDGYVRLWDCDTHVLLAKSSYMDARVRAVAFNRDGSLVVVGLGGTLDMDDEIGRRDGQLKVLLVNVDTDGDDDEDDAGAAATERPLTLSSTAPSRRAKDQPFTLFCERHDAKAAIRDLRFSKKARWLAVASEDRLVYIYDARANAFEKIGQCRGHLAFVTRIDFSEDEAYMRTNCDDGDLLYWHAGTAHAIPGGVSQLRDVDWHTERCAYVALDCSARSSSLALTDDPARFN